MRIKIDAEIKNAYLKIVLTEVIGWIISFIIIFAFNNFIEVSDKMGSYLGFLPSTIFWLLLNAVAISVYAGVRNLKYIFLQIVVSLIAYLSFLYFLYSYIAFTSEEYAIGSMNFIFYVGMKREFLFSFLLTIFLLLTLSFMTRAIIVIWRKIHITK